MSVCPHPGCTGVHDNSRYHELCPAAIERKRVKDTRWSRRNPDLVFLKHQREQAKNRLQRLADLGIDISQFTE